MSVKLKTKLSLGLIFLFIVIVLFGVLGLFYINQLSKEGRQVLQNNQESLLYCNRMLQSLEDIRTQKDAMAIFSDNLKRQQGNITEIGEREATDELTKNYNEMLADPTVADAICDRLVHNAHVLSLKGPSIRKVKGLGEKKDEQG